MKKALKIIILQLLIICLIMPFVNAETTYCKIALSCNKSQLEPGDEITVNVTMSNINASGGIANLIGVLKYSPDVFEIVSDESTNAINEMAQFEAQYASQLSQGSEYSLAMLYMGKNDIDNTGNDWNMVVLYDSDSEETDEENIIMLYSDELQTETQIIAKVTLRVRDDAPKTNTEISLKDMTAYDENGDDSEIKDSSISFSINGTNIGGTGSGQGTGTGSGTGTGTGSGSGSGQGTGTGAGTGSGQGTVGGSNQNSNTAKENAPFTGIEDYIPAAIVILIIGIISFINYRRYKDVY